MDTGGLQFHHARFGVIEFWIISPETRQLQIYDLPREYTRILEESDTAKTPLLPGLPIPVAERFAD